MAPTKLRLADLTICFSGNFSSADPEIKRWVQANGGVYSKQITDNTTHLVVTKSNWRARNPEVNAALQNPEIKIVTWDWFDDKLREKGRVTDSKYLWSRIDEDRLKQKQKQQKAAEREKNRADKEEAKKKKDAEKIDWSGALLQHTNVVARHQNSDDESEQESPESSQHAEEFAKGAKKAKAALLDDNYHYYMDETSFIYNVRLFKLSVELMRMDTARITLYESNAQPPVYACVTEIGEEPPLDRKIRSPMGTNFPTTFRAFRKNFEELTGVNWNDRAEKFTHSLRDHRGIVAEPDKTESKELSKAKKAKKAAQPELTPQQLREKHEKALQEMKFRYRLPAEDQPRGTFENGKHLGRPKRWAHQDGKSVYELFGFAGDNGRAALRRKQRMAAELSEKQKGLKKLGKKVEQAIIIDDSDDENMESKSSSEDEDKDEGDVADAGNVGNAAGIPGYVPAGPIPRHYIAGPATDSTAGPTPGGHEPGYVVVSKDGKDVEMSEESEDGNEGDKNDKSAEADQQDQIMVDA